MLRCKAMSRADQSIIDALTAALAAGHRRWPTVHIPEDVYHAYVLEHVGDPPSAAAIDEIKHDELYLCCACATGNAMAVMALEQHYLSKVVGSIVKLRLGSATTDELMQQLRLELYAGRQGKVPKIRTYAGQGSLEGWLRVIALRAGLNRKRRDGRQLPADSLLLEGVGNDADDAELAQIKKRYQPLFASSLTWAFRQLHAEQRTLLRMYVTDDLTVAQLGNLHDVDKGTVSRWLTKIRQQLLKDTRTRLIQQHQMRVSECDSIMRVARSGLHLSVHRLLAEDHE